MTEVTARSSKASAVSSRSLIVSSPLALRAEPPPSACKTAHAAGAGIVTTAMTQGAPTQKHVESIHGRYQAAQCE